MWTLLDRLWRTIFTGSSFLFFFMGGAILSYLVLPILALSSSRDQRVSRCRRLVARAWVLFHDYMRVTRLLKYDPRRTGFALPPGPFVMVANHPTLVDVTALVSACPDLAIVAKRGMFRSPVLGPLLRRCDHIEAGDGSAFSGLGVVEQALDRLRGGSSVLIFPEGTRSPEGGLGPFHAGAFQIAALAGVPIVPVLMRCDPPTLMRGQPWYAIPERTAELTITQLPHIAAADGGHPAVLAHQMRAMFVGRLQAARAIAPAEAVASPSTPITDL